MPLGIVSDEEFEQEVTRHQPSVAIEKLHRGGRRKNDIEVPSSLRKIIADEKLEHGRASAVHLARELRISPQSVDAYGRGSTSLAFPKNSSPELVEHLNKVKNRIVKKSSSRLLSALNHITSEKLESAKVRDLASIAQAMSVIMKNMEPEQAAQTHVGPNFIFYVPRKKSEEEYESLVEQHG
ncbi:MAG: hypothetical protein QXE45_04510 [Thermoplasmata archaeon]